MVGKQGVWLGIANVDASPNVPAMFNQRGGCIFYSVVLCSSRVKSLQVSCNYRVDFHL